MSPGSGSHIPWGVWTPPSAHPLGDSRTEAPHSLGSPATAFGFGVPFYLPCCLQGGWWGLRRSALREGPRSCVDTCGWQGLA